MKVIKNPQNYISIRGARVHNLKNIDLDIPKNKLVVITGVSGSGKSSLAFDTLYAEGQRRYVESLSSYARQFLGVMQKPDVDKIEGISPAISIDQRKSSHNPRSTVGTMTEIFDYLRVLFARIGAPHCPKCDREVKKQTIDQIVSQILALPPKSEVYILGPMVKAKKGEHKAILMEASRAGFVRVRIDGIVQRIDEAIEKDIDRQKKHNIEIVVDRLILDKDLEKSRLVDSLEIALRLGKGAVIIQKSKIKDQKEGDLIFSEHFACDYCEISLPEIEPRLFSFNSPFGACSSCQGLGKKLEVSPDLVMPNKNLSIAEGAIFPWARASHKIGRQGYYWNLLQDLAEKYKFSLDKPIKDLPPEIIELILYGENKNDVQRSMSNVQGFEGVVNNLQRRYWETDSDWAKEEIQRYMKAKVCEKCHGQRLNQEALAVKVNKFSIANVSDMPARKCKDFFEGLLENLNQNNAKIAGPLIKEIVSRLGFLVEVGLDYLTLSRETETLSGGEEQRARLATQIGSKLTGVLYILDEPSVGLHPRDQNKLITTLKELRDVGNTVIVVEHDPLTVKEADWIIDIGPMAGKRGGKVVFEGTPKQLLRSKTLTGDYLSGRKKISIKESGIRNQELRGATQKYLIIKGARENNLKNIDVKIPLGKFVCVTGVSGSGKSSLVNDILAKALYQKFYKSKDIVGEYDEILGAEFLDKVVLVDQSPIGRTPRSNPATYTSAFNYIRDIFTKTKEARLRGFKLGRFSFNVKGGRCEECEGQGVKKIEMYFLPDIYVQCQECHGQRYNKETLEIDYKGKSISDVLNMTVEEAMDFFKNIPVLNQKLKTLNEVGLSYVELGQPAPSLSGGEAQRIKLATELSKKSTGKTLYILDEPTTGLHPDDINKLLFVLKALVEKGNTVLIIEHNLELAAQADWIIDLGPESGEKGGQIVVEGIPSQISQNKISWTGRYLNKIL
ncbi:MAG: excinuclease ABC subunit UvrA [Candidatus Pacebacteria bacterium]|nr:excinuclease ABC subunit UvrA [Candidatus Paceibacterota bacterium]